VGPWGSTDSDEFWNAENFNGAVLALGDLDAEPDPAATAMNFLRTGRTLLVSHA
jgi:hypothetical protein